MISVQSSILANKMLLPWFHIISRWGTLSEVLPLVMLKNMYQEYHGLSATMRLAKRYNGLALLWEHRFYGDSLPFPINV